MHSNWYRAWFHFHFDKKFEYCHWSGTNARQHKIQTSICWRLSKIPPTNFNFRVSFLFSRLQRRPNRPAWGRFLILWEVKCALGINWKTKAAQTGHLSTFRNGIRVCYGIRNGLLTEMDQSDVTIARVGWFFFRFFLFFYFSDVWNSNP